MWLFFLKTPTTTKGSVAKQVSFKVVLFFAMQRVQCGCLKLEIRECHCFASERSVLITLYWRCPAVTHTGLKGRLCLEPVYEAFGAVVLVSVWEWLA